tara:strand:- start:721 stop:1365 length:645 start_codon:yes stop_codon:yes gene_type:complete
MFGMMFGGEVSQKVFQVTVLHDEAIHFSEIWPDYNLEWAVINIIDCPTQECWIAYEGRYLSETWVWNSSNEQMYSVNQGQTFYYTNKNSSRLDIGFCLAEDEDICANNTYTIGLLVTAEFPEEDTGYIDIEDEDFYSIKTGNNLLSSPCRDEIAIEDALPPEIESNLSGIITEGQAATQVDGEWLGSLSHLKGNRGYWFVSNIEEEFNYTCTEN